MLTDLSWGDYVLFLVWIMINDCFLAIGEIAQFYSKQTPTEKITQDTLLFTWGFETSGSSRCFHDWKNQHSFFSQTCQIGCFLSQNTAWYKLGSWGDTFLACSSWIYGLNSASYSSRLRKQASYLLLNSFYWAVFSFPLAICGDLAKDEWTPGGLC